MWNPFKSTPWSLHNPLKGWTLHGLSEREARLLLVTLSPAEKKVVAIWHAGWEKWESLDSDRCVFLQRSFSNAPPLTPALPELSRGEETVAVKISAKPKPYDLAREHVRYPVFVPAEVVRGAQSFRTKTMDVSAGGMRLQDCLPEWVSGYFTVILGLERGPLEVTCKLVEDQKAEKIRVEVVETDDEESQLPIYLQWIKSLS